MRKRLIPHAGRFPASPGDAWLDVERVATVEITSEAGAHPIEAAFRSGSAGQSGGWRAAEPGPQLIRIRFDAPLALRRIRLLIVETDDERTQEFVLRSSRDGGQSFEEIVRQQWHFSPGGATSELEEYAVDLPGVTVLELDIDPDRGRGRATASLAELRLAE